MNKFCFGDRLDILCKLIDEKLMLETRDNFQTCLDAVPSLEAELDSDKVECSSLAYSERIVV